MRYLLILLICLVGCESSVNQPAPRVTVEPVWTTYAPLRTIRDMGPVLTDVESHLHAGHPYANPGDLVNWAHEGTHGINSDLRQTYHRAGFYVLNNRAVLIDNPPITLTAVAREIPPSLRGFCYSLYFVQQLRDWDDTPTYPFDEWVSYSNGAEARLRRNIPGRDDTVQFALEFVPYSICVAKAMRTAGLAADPQMRAFIRWQTERCVLLGHTSGKTIPRLDATDAAALRAFAKDYFGSTWAARNLGI